MADSDKDRNLSTPTHLNDAVDSRQNDAANTGQDDIQENDFQEGAPYYFPYPPMYPPMPPQMPPPMGYPMMRPPMYPQMPPQMPMYPPQIPPQMPMYPPQMPPPMWYNGQAQEQPNGGRRKLRTKSTRQAVSNNRANFNVDNELEDDDEDAGTPITEQDIKEQQIAKIKERLRVERAQEQRFKQANATIETKKREIFTKSVAVILFKIFFFVLIVTVLIGGLLMLVKQHRDELIQRGSAAIKENSYIPEENTETFVNLSNTQVGTIIKSFYDKNGRLENYFRLNDSLTKGAIKLKEVIGSFYCIKKSNGRSYIKIETTDGIKAFLVGTHSEGVKLLTTATMSGGKENIDENTAAVVRAITSFADSLFVRTFTTKDSSQFSGLMYDGKTDINGISCDVVTVAETGGAVIQYYLKTDEGKLVETRMKFGTHKLEIYYSDYRPVDSFKFPFRRVIALDGIPIATIDIHSIAINHGAVFPQ